MHVVSTPVGFSWHDELASLVVSFEGQAKKDFIRLDNPVHFNGLHHGLKRIQIFVTPNKGCRRADVAFLGCLAYGLAFQHAFGKGLMRCPGFATMFQQSACKRTKTPAAVGTEIALRPILRMAVPLAWGMAVGTQHFSLGRWLGNVSVRFFGRFH